MAAPVTHERVVQGRFWEGPLHIPRVETTDRLVAHQNEVVGSKRITEFLAARMQEKIVPIGDLWMPPDFFPKTSQPNYQEKVMEIRDRAEKLPRELLIVTALHAITEDDLQAFSKALNTFSSMRDRWGIDDHTWALWDREWATQEFRHGGALSRYLDLSARVNMHEYGNMTAHLMRNGFNMDVNTPYEFLIFTADQERKTKVTHGRSGMEAKEYGDVLLYLICTKVSGEEGNHEDIYSDVFGEIFDIDQDGAMIALRDKSKRPVIMPSMLIDDGRMRSTARMPRLFLKFGDVEEELGTFNFYQDTADDLTHFMKKWKTQERTGLSPEAAAAQEELPLIHQNLVERAERQSEERKVRAPLDLSAFDFLVPPTPRKTIIVLDDKKPNGTLYEKE